MCDPGDLGLNTDFSFPLANRRPSILFYEYIPAGIGFSHFLFENLSDLLEKAYRAVNNCACDLGCPACVGPGGELGSGGKEETKAILDILCK
jgi:DEAD/DEAH box helicase domain-containing protein